MKSFFEEAPNPDGEVPGTLTYSGAVLAIISTILGGGIVGLPYSLYSTGLYCGVLIAIFAAAQTTISSILFLKAREVCPNRPSSLFEIGYLTLGRASIFIICFLVWVNSFFLIIIFVNVFSNTAVNVMKALVWYNCQDNLGTHVASYAIGIAILLLPTTFMKEIAELHLVSISLFCAALFFVAINFFQLVVRGNSLSNPDHGNYKEYGLPELRSFGQPDSPIELSNVLHIINAVTVIFTACNFQANLFPIHSNQKDKSIKQSVKIITTTMILVDCVYIIVSVSTIFMYGSNIEDNVLQNIG